MAKFARSEIRNILGDVCTDEIENKLIALHLGVVDPLKDEINKYKPDAEKLPQVQKELDELKQGDYKAKYEKEHSDFDTYKKDVQAKETKAAKESAVKAYFESKNITGTNLEIAMRGAKDEIDAVEIEDGKIKDSKALDALVSGTFAGLVVTKRVEGAPQVKPPANNPGNEPKPSRAAELAKLYHENLYGKGE